MKNKPTEAHITDSVKEIMRFLNDKNWGPHDAIAFLSIALSIILEDLEGQGILNSEGRKKLTSTAIDLIEARFKSTYAEKSPIDEALKKYKQKNDQKMNPHQH